jgi:hypothetical protein
MNRTDHNLFGVQQEKAEIDLALEQYRREWRPFLHELGITLAQLRSLDTSVLMAILLLNLNAKLGERLNEFELRLRALEVAPRSEVPRPLGRSPSLTGD